MGFIIHTFVLVIAVAALNPQKQIQLAAVTPPAPYTTMDACKADVKQSIEKARLEKATDPTLIGVAIGCAPVDIVLEPATTTTP
jgi:hypothetical protein